mgnify:CR=1 FL=1
MELVPISYIALAVSAFLVGIDQILKMLVQANLELHESISLIPGIISLTYVENTGAAFNSFDGQRWFLIGLTGLAVLFMLYLLVFNRLKNPVIIWHVAVILAGGVGNLIDRIFRGGSVIDYIEFKFVNFAIFNFADCMVVLGVISLLVYMLFFDQSDLFHRKKKTDTDRAE